MTIWIHNERSASIFYYGAIGANSVVIKQTPMATNLNLFITCHEVLILTTDQKR